jgi:hypothetical protein
MMTHEAIDLNMNFCIEARSGFAVAQAAAAVQARSGLLIYSERPSEHFKDLSACV